MLTCQLTHEEMNVISSRSIKVYNIMLFFQYNIKFCYMLDEIVRSGEIFAFFIQSIVNF